MPQARQILVSALRNRPFGEAPGFRLGRAAEIELVALALAEGLAAPVHDALAHSLSATARDELQAQVRQETVRHLVYLELLRRLGEALGGADIPWLVLKGPVLFERFYGHTGRSYSDLDLLVPASWMGSAIEVLRRVGADFRDEDWHFLVRSVKGEISLAVSGLRLIDLHWHVVYLRSARERFRIPTEELLERRRPVNLGGTRAWALERTDFVAHLALHACLTGAQRLRRLLDIQKTVVTDPPDWDLLVQRCHAWRIGLPVATMLNSATEVLGAPVPNEVIALLAGGQLNRLVVRQLRSWAPPGRRLGGRSIRTGVSRSLRDTLTATTEEFGREVRRALLTILVPATRSTSEGKQSEHEYNDALGLEAYLALMSRVDPHGHLVP